MPGIAARADVDAFWKLVKVRTGIDRSHSIVSGTNSAKHVVLLLEGVACSFAWNEDGGRQIHAFHYPGNFLALDSLMFSQSVEPSEVQAPASCSIGIIARDPLEQAIQYHPALGRALWR